MQIKNRGDPQRLQPRGVINSGVVIDVLVCGALLGSRTFLRLLVRLIVGCVVAADLVCRVWRGAGIVQTLHLVVFTKFTLFYLHVGLWLVKHLPHFISSRMVQFMGETYHGKTLTHEDAKALVTHESAICHDLGEKIIPYEIARSLVLEGPPKIAVAQCPCRASRQHHCEPVDVCMLLGTFVDVAAKLGKPTKRLSTQEAIELLDAEHARGHVHSVWFKDAVNGQAFALCNCCKCCCAGIELMINHGATNIISSGYVATRTDSHPRNDHSQMDKDGESENHSDQKQNQKCIGCGVCAKACPFGAISISAQDKAKGAQVDSQKCLGCGVCVSKCPRKCLSLTRDPTKPPPLDVTNLF
ncbi:4Fe-4S ferredoxin [Pelomyxa schiedti]|nr:4Fe-4S ferredoxin [Pelomyxa schiedti]